MSSGGCEGVLLGVGEVGDNPQRIRTEAAFAHLCGVAPIPASSGKTIRHRLNRGGNRQANSALFHIVLTRMKHHQPTHCETSLYPTQGAHGISGDLGAFNFITSAIDEYKVVLYGEDATAGDLVAFIHCYHNGKNVMSCEFYRDGAALPDNR